MLFRHLRDVGSRLCEGGDNDSLEVKEHREAARREIRIYKDRERLVINPAIEALEICRPHLAENLKDVMMDLEDEVTTAIEESGANKKVLDSARSVRSVGDRVIRLLYEAGGRPARSVDLPE